MPFALSSVCLTGQPQGLPDLGRVSPGAHLWTCFSPVPFGGTSSLAPGGAPCAQGGQDSLAHIQGRVLCLLGCGPPSVARALCAVILRTSSGSVPTLRVRLCAWAPSSCLSVSGSAHPLPIPSVYVPPTGCVSSHKRCVSRALPGVEVSPHSCAQGHPWGSTVPIQRPQNTTHHSHAFFPLVSRCLWVLCGHRHGLSEARGLQQWVMRWLTGGPPDCSTCLCLLDDLGRFLKGISFCNADGVALLQKPRVCVEVNLPGLVVPSPRQTSPPQ